MYDNYCATNKLQPLTYLIVLNYNGKRLLQRCLSSLKKTRYGNMRVLVVDNGSVDGSVEMVKREFRDVEVLALRRNLGYAAANNLGILYSLRRGAKYVVLLNNDIEVLDPLWLYLSVKIFGKP